MQSSVARNWFQSLDFPRTASFALLALRVIFGAAFALHGFGKIVNAFGWMGAESGVPAIFQAAAAVAEFGGGVAMVIGLLTPGAALGLLSTMIGALALVHLPAGHPFVASNPGQPSFELALIYAAIALLFLMVGPGRYSLDAWLILAARGARKPKT